MDRTGGLRRTLMALALAAGSTGGLVALAAQAGPGPRLEVASSEPARFPLGIGRAATEGEIAALDLDVGPDGVGLPPGSGTPAQGEAIYRASCAVCHGPDGNGTPAGWPLVGRNPGDRFDFGESLEAEIRRTIGNYWPHATTLFDYTLRAMPMDRPGSLSADQVYALTAWMLWRNGIVPQDIELDAEALMQVRMPAADRFIPDDRGR
jgi:S-disulfanyl-L-cysteine oxidoreductase SoxD